MEKSKDDYIKEALGVLEYVYHGMKSPEEKTQIAGAMYYLEKALAMQKAERKFNSTISTTGGKHGRIY